MNVSVVWMCVCVCRWRRRSRLCLRCWRPKRSGWPRSRRSWASRHSTNWSTTSPRPGRRSPPPTRTCTPPPWLHLSLKISGHCLTGVILQDASHILVASDVHHFIHPLLLHISPTATDGHPRHWPRPVRRRRRPFPTLARPSPRSWRMSGQSDGLKAGKLNRGIFYLAAYYL